MADTRRTFRIFVSSTFTDLSEERNALHRDCFPRLRRLCTEHGARFQAIDLRWGVSKEAGLDQRAMAICLEEIARCRNVSPRPNFIVLLGERFGWRPLPAEIEASEFAAIVEALHRSPNPASADPAMLADWYIREDNSIPVVYRLKARTGESEQEGVWSGVEARLHAVFARGIRDLPLSPAARLKYGASATAQEIERGVLAIPDAHEHVFGFFRTIEGVPDDDTAHEFIDLDAAGRRDAEAAAHLRELKSRLRQALPDTVRETQFASTARNGWDRLRRSHLTQTACVPLHS
jgi:NACHT domain- and WD repeat-containing protein